MKYKGKGYYNKDNGQLIELDKYCSREVEQGEVWEGSKQDFEETFLI